MTLCAPETKNGARRQSPDWIFASSGTDRTIQKEQVSLQVQRVVLETTETYGGVASCKGRQQWGHPIRGSDQREGGRPKRNRVNLRRGSMTNHNTSGTPCTLVLFSVGLSCSAKQGNTKDVSVAGESILRFGEDGNAVTELAQVRKLSSLQFHVRNFSSSSYLMATDFKLGEVPRGVFMGRALDVSKRGLIGGNLAMDVQGYLNCV